LTEPIRVEALPPVAHFRHIVLVNEFYHPDLCASAVVAADHAAKFAAARPDWRFTVLTSNRAWADPDTIYPDYEVIDGVHVVRVARPALRRKSLLARGIGFFAFQRNALRAAERLGPIDLVIGTTAPPQGARIAAMIAKLHRCPYVYKVLDVYPEVVEALGQIRLSSVFFDRWRRSDMKIMRRAAAVVAISETMLKHLSDTRDLPYELRHVIHDGFDDARLAFTGPNDFRALTAPPGVFVVQYAGNMGLSHPFETILEAAWRLRDDPSIRFQFIGDGPQREKIARDLPPNARLLDYQPADRLGMILDAADLCLISQHRDLYDCALPYKIYAILAAGRPTIFLGNPKSDIAEWLRIHDCGFSLIQGDTDALIESIQHLKNDPARCVEMGRHARNLFVTTFHSDRAVKDWLVLFDQVFARRADVAQ
jgi:colanic acid biosynthesis glycosyl transferase WcaI